MGYTRDAIKGVSWVSAFRFATRILAFIKVLVLARVLTPDQFGVFGIASLILSLLEMLTDTGINIILVQTTKNISEYINSAWVVSIMRGGVIGIIIFICAPLVASFFHSKASLDIILFISVIPIVRGFINPAEVIMQKELKFRYEFWFRTAIFTLDACVSIILSVITKSVYSLVWGMLAGVLLEVLLSFILLTPRPRFSIQKNYFNEIFHKGKWITAYGFFNYAAENLDNFIVGKVVGTSALGLYQMAYKISILPISEISDVVSRVVFPVYTKISGDKQRLSLAFFKTISSMMISCMLLGLVIFFFPEQIILILLGAKWISAAPALKVLAIYGALNTLPGPASALFLSIGKQNFVTIMTFIRLLVLGIIIYPLVREYGLIGAGSAQLIAILVEIPIIILLINKIFRKN